MIWLAWGAASAVLAAQEKVAVLPIHHRGMGEVAQQLRDAVGTAVAGAKFAVVPAAEADAAAQGVLDGEGGLDSAGAAAVGKKTGAAWVVTGKVFQAGPVTFLLVKVLSADSDAVFAAAKQVPAGGDMAAAVREVSGDIARQLAGR
jgi:hypothetical protein